MVWSVIQEGREGGVQAVFFRLLLCSNLPKVLNCCMCLWTDQSVLLVSCPCSSFQKAQEPLTLFWGWVRCFTPVFFEPRFSLMWPELILKEIIESLLLPSLCQASSVSTCRAEFLATSPINFLLPPAAGVKAKHNGNRSLFSYLLIAF